MSSSSKAPSLLSKLQGLIKPPWKLTGPTSNPDYLPCLPTALEYRVHSPASPPRQAIIPGADPSLVYDIKYYTRNPAHKIARVYREHDPNATRARLNATQFTPEDANTLKELGFNYDELTASPTLYKRKSILDYANNGYE